MEKMNKINYQCCFCGKSIEVTKFDITSILVTSNWDKNINKQQEQQFFCHMKCLKLKFHHDTPLYLLDLVD